MPLTQYIPRRLRNIHHTLRPRNESYNDLVAQSSVGNRLCNLRFRICMLEFCGHSSDGL